MLWPGVKPGFPVLVDSSYLRCNEYWTILDCIVLYCILPDLSKNSLASYCILPDLSKNSIASYCILPDLSKNSIASCCILPDLSNFSIALYCILLDLPKFSNALYCILSNLPKNSISLHQRLKAQELRFWILRSSWFQKDILVICLRRAVSGRKNLSFTIQTAIFKYQSIKVSNKTFKSCQNNITETQLKLRGNCMRQNKGKVTNE